MSEITDILDEIDAERAVRSERFKLIADLDQQTDRESSVAEVDPATRLALLFEWHVEQTQAQFDAVAAAIEFDLNILDRLARVVAELRP